MATKTESKSVPQDADGNNEDAWETVNTGSLGDEWDFDRNGPLTGNFLGVREVTTAKTQTGKAIAIQFAPQANPDEVVFIWQSADLMAFTEDDRFIIGGLYRITFLGTRQFTAADGPRIIKQYRIQWPKLV